jgi:hypothetical protein
MLKRNYLLLRDLIHQQALQQQQALVEIDEAVTIHRNKMMALWRRPRTASEHIANTAYLVYARCLNNNEIINYEQQKTVRGG